MLQAMTNITENSSKSDAYGRDIMSSMWRNRKITFEKIPSGTNVGEHDERLKNFNRISTTKDAYVEDRVAPNEPKSVKSLQVWIFVGTFSKLLGTKRGCLYLLVVRFKWLIVKFSSSCQNSSICGINGLKINIFFVKTSIKTVLLVWENLFSASQVYNIKTWSKLKIQFVKYILNGWFILLNWIKLYIKILLLNCFSVT